LRTRFSLFSRLKFAFSSSAQKIEPQTVSSEKPLINKRLWFFSSVFQRVQAFRPFRYNTTRGCYAWTSFLAKYTETSTGLTFNSRHPTTTPLKSFDERHGKGKEMIHQRTITLGNNKLELWRMNDHDSGFTRKTSFIATHDFFGRRPTHFSMHVSNDFTCFLLYRKNHCLRGSDGERTRTHSAFMTHSQTNRPNERCTGRRSSEEETWTKNEAKGEPKRNV